MTMVEILGIVSVAVLIMVMLFSGLKWLFPNGAKPYFCSHDWQYYKSQQSSASFNGNVFTSTDQIVKCSKCGDMRKL